MAPERCTFISSRRPAARGSTRWRHRLPQLFLPGPRARLPSPRARGGRRTWGRGSPPAPCRAHAWKPPLFSLNVASPLRAFPPPALGKSVFQGGCWSDSAPRPYPIRGKSPRVARCFPGRFPQTLFTDEGRWPRGESDLPSAAVLCLRSFQKGFWG